MEVKCHCNKTKLTEEENGPPPHHLYCLKKYFIFIVNYFICLVDFDFGDVFANQNNFCVCSCSMAQFFDSIFETV